MIKSNHSEGIISPEEAYVVHVHKVPELEYFLVPLLKNIGISFTTTHCPMAAIWNNSRSFEKHACACARRKD